MRYGNSTLRKGNRNLKEQVSPAAPPADAILLGLNRATGEPVHVSRELLGSGHLHIRGRTGAGKTSRALLPLILQLIASDPRTGGTPEPIVVIDLGGDRALFHSIASAARHADRVFRFFSLDPDDAWHYFDPFQAASYRSERVIEMAEMLIEAFGLDNGPIYGGQYFTAQNLRALLHVATQLVKQKADLGEITIDDISKYLARNDRQIADAEQIRATFEFLKQYRQLKPLATTPQDQVIDLHRAIQHGEVIYFFLPSMGKSVTVRPVAGLALFSLQQIAMRRPNQGLPMRRTWVLIDEFQSLAGRSFENFLAQCRKFGLSLVLCHQTLSQLRNRDTALDDVVAKNTAVKLFFTVEGVDEVEELQAMSRTERILLGGTTDTRTETHSTGSMQGQSFTKSARSSTTHSTSNSQSTSQGTASAVSQREQIMPALELNEIQEVSATDGQFFLLLTTGRGHQQPLAVQGLHYVHPDVHRTIGDRPLPRRPLAVTATIAAAPPPPDPSPPKPKSGPARNEERQLLLEKLAHDIETRLRLIDLKGTTKRQ